MTRPTLTHVALNCTDVARTIAFYRDFAGMHVVHERVDGDVSVAWISREPADPTFVLVLIQGPGRQPDGVPAVDHLGFECATREEVDAAAAKAQARGIPVPHPPIELPPPVGYITIITDPDGNRVEFSYGQPINSRKQ